MSIDQEFLSLFLDEAEEMLSNWEKCCLALEKKHSPDQLNALFRAAHNLKGSSRSVGLTAFGSFIHTAEDLITKLKNEQIEVKNEHISALLETQKILMDWVVFLRGDPNYVADHSSLTKKLLELTAGTADMSKGNQNSSAFGFFDDPQVTPVAASPSPPASTLQSAQTVSTNATQATKADSSIRVSLEKIDQIIRLAGELAIQQASVRRNLKAIDLSIDALGALSASEKVVQDLHTEALSLRMLPIGGLFQRMERVSRDVAKLQNKPINVVLMGEDVELDKQVLERIKDPLVHILRNAVDHGLEMPADRIAAKKPEFGTVTIEAKQTPAFISITVADDGRGLGKARILNKAREKGLIDKNAVLSDEDIFQLIFLPGFSTAEVVTDVSGRGVGMDVVKRTLEELHGTITIASEDGKGTKFTINLPSTLSIVQVAIIRVLKDLYAIPVQDIGEFFSIEPEMIQKQENSRELLKFRDEILSLEHLAHFLTPKDPASDLPRGEIGFIPRNQQTRLALRVDQLIETQSIVVGGIDPKIKSIPGLSGGTILSSGDPAMIIDIKQIIDFYTLKKEAMEPRIDD